MINLNENMIILDVETGGLDPRKHSLLSIGMVFVSNGQFVGEKEWFLRHDEYNVTPRAMEVNGINLVEHHKKARPLDEIVTEFLMIIERNYEIGVKPTIVGHNVGFDIGFIHNQFIPKEKWEKFISYRNVDTAGISRFLIDCGVIKSRKSDLSSLLEYFGVGSEQSQGRHSAHWDAVQTWEVYKLMCDLIKDKFKEEE